MALYINDLVLGKASISAITSAFCSIRWGHINTGHFSPTDHPFVKLAFEGAKRSIESNNKNQKEPLDAEAIKMLINKFGFNKHLLQLRFIIICLIGFAGFFKISELLSVQTKHISLHKDHIDIMVEKSKTDQLREGHIVKISMNGTSYCPHYWLKKYLELSELDKNPEGILLCRLTGHKVNYQCPITYETARKTVLDHLRW